MAFSDRQSPATDVFPPSGGKTYKVRSKFLRQLLMATVFLACALYVAKGLKRGWVATDEGYLAQTAERVLHGELPHRDFDEGYTGGLTYLNAVAFRLFGTNLASLRYPLFLFVLAWIPAFYYVASQFVSAPIACAVTFLGVAWSVPNYSAAMPSWYNLFFATFGLAALLRYIKTENPTWLFSAALSGGFSFLFKLSGLYFVAGALFFLLFRERVTAEVKAPGSAKNGLYRAFLVGSVFAYEVLVFGLLRKAGNLTTFLYFGVPDLAIGGTILWLEFYSPRGQENRFSRLFRELAVFGAGVVLPIGLFVLSCALTGSLREFRRAIFVLPANQLMYSSYNQAVRKLAIGIVINLVFIAIAFLTTPRVRKVFGIVCTLGIPAALFLAQKFQYIDRAEWAAIWNLLPILLVIGAWLLVRGSLKNTDAIRQQQFFLVLSVTAACNLIQYPFNIPIYFCYVAPLAVLSAVGVVSNVKSASGWVSFAAVCFGFLYVVLIFTPGFIEPMGEWYSPDKNVARLDLPRGGGLRVYPGNARLYEDLYAVVKQHARGEYIYATPDCPQVYFLNGFRNPTRTFFDFEDSHPDRTERILSTIHVHDINLVVLNERPLFSEKATLELRTALEEEFPDHVAVGIFDVRWKP
jgi:Dolichyl-phosphate-mannose-protein mannosyltransferase